MNFLAAYGPFWTFAFMLVICVTVVKALKIWRARVDAEESNPDEVREMQEFNRSLHRMESRIDALETILIDRARKTAERNWDEERRP